MKRKTIDAQLNNRNCQNYYLRRCLMLAENVFNIKKLPLYIDKSYMNKVLVRQGSIAFFRDEVLGLLALPYTINGTLDVYNRPKSITVMGKNGYMKTLKNTIDKTEFVILYDNQGRYPLYLDIYQYAYRLALYERTADINIAQQKTPRIWKCKTDNELTLRQALWEVDSFEETITTYDNIDLDEISCILSPAPFVADKIHQEKRNLWNEFLSLIGIANLGVEKKERQIVDEIASMQGGTVASRFARFTPREDAVELINKYLIKDGEEKLEVEYYDGLPTTLKEDDISNEKEVNENIIKMESGDDNV